MKINWKVLMASVLIIGVVAWAISSLLPHSFSGANLTFAFTTGTVTVSNPSDTPVPVQLVGTGSRTFTVSSSIDGVSGSSTRQSTGTSATSQLFEFALPPGKSDLTVERGTNVNFISTTDTKLEAIVQPISRAEVKTTLIAAAVVIVIALFYISRNTGHRWINALRRQQVPAPVSAVPVVTLAEGDSNRGRDGRMYSNYGGKD
jgi:hypothetical protein